MSNPYFRFKQFTVWQNRCAMKVSTDACLLGAYTRTGEAGTLLDIGTGTGLLALMAAQRSQARIDAVELEAEAAQQAAENVQRSPFASRIRVIHQRIQEFARSAPGGYDVIVSNPPFFSNHLLSPRASRNAALHTENLSHGDLLAAVARLLAPSGRFFVLLPPYEAGGLVENARAFGLFPVQRLLVRHAASHPVFRVVLTLGRTPETTVDETLVIYAPDQQYTNAFRAIMKAYYLAL